LGRPHAAADAGIAEAETLMTAGVSTAFPTAPSVGRLAQAAYGVGQIAGQIFRDVPSLLLLFFMTNALGIQPALAGAAIFIPKLVFGVICDVGVGILSDRWKARIRRRWWLLVGAGGAPFALILLFHVPGGSQVVKAAYVAGAFSLYMAVFSVLSVPYLAIASELSTDTRQRTVIMAWRLVFTAVGVLIAGSFSPIFIQMRGGGQGAYEALSIILATICPLSLLVAFFAATRADRRTIEPAAPPFARGLSIRDALQALAHPRFSVLVGSNLLMLVSSGMAYASMIYFLTYNLGRPDALEQVGGITLIACATIVIAQPIWVRLATMLGKRRTYLVSAVAYAGVSIGWGVFGRLGLGVDYALAAVLGLANSGWSLMGFSMLSDLSDDGRGGLYASVWVAADKIGFALGGTLLVGGLLAASGFDSARAMAGLSQGPDAVTGVLLCFSVFPAILSLIASALLARWGNVGSRPI
jgi:GPH family glycoside/pentoside/hexuronide:cation symporter